MTSLRTHFIGKGPTGWKQAEDSKFNKNIFFTHINFVDNKTHCLFAIVNDSSLYV